MKNKFLVAIAGFMIAGTAWMGFTGGEEKYPTIELKTKAPLQTEKMVDINGAKLSLADIKKANGLLVIFSCNTCPFVINWEDRYPELAKLAEQNNIGFVLVNSNEAKRTNDDSLEEMKKHAKDKGYANVHYVVDNNSALANAFGAKSTPHVFLFDKNMELVYRGAIDDNNKSAAEVKEHYLKDAMTALVANKPIVKADTKAMGCSIKRAS